MSKLIIRGGKKLAGIWTLSGNKNEALPLVAASILFKNKLVLKNLPLIEDVKIMLDIAQALGTGVDLTSRGHQFSKRGEVLSKIPESLGAKVRGSLLFLGPQLILSGRAEIPDSGGDKIGLRKTDHHLEVFKSFGCKVSGNRISLDRTNLNSGKDIRVWLSEPSVTATESAMIMASNRLGITIIKNAACEPHIVGLGNALIKAGAKINGLGANHLTIRGSRHFKAVEHTIGDDFMEMGSILALSAIFKDKIRISVKDAEEYEKIFEIMEKFGKRIEHDGEQLKVSSIKNYVGSRIEEISSQPWPSFPSDLMSAFIVLATQTNGYYLFHEKMFESRLYFTDQLKSLGAKLVLCDPHRVLVVGPSKLRGARLVSPDIRAGMALLIAALSASGESVINNAEQLDRGYENYVEKLKNIGADIRKED